MIDELGGLRRRWRSATPPRAIAVSDRTRLGGLTQFVSTIGVTHAKPLNIKKMAERADSKRRVP